MKRYLTKIPTILFAALLLASCSGSDATEQAGGSAAASVVSFTVTTDDAATRGIIPNTTAFLTDGQQFRVWAFMQKNNTGEWSQMTSDYNTVPMQAVDVTYVKWRNEWTTEATWYWPRPEYAVNFYAVYPNTVIFNTTNKTLDYTVPTDNTGEDVMYATHQGQRNGTELPNQRKPAPLTFHHALTQVSFYGKLNTLLLSLGWTIEVNNIKLCNVKGQGSLPMYITSGSSAQALATQFTNLSTPTTYTFAMNADRQALTTTAVAKDSENKDIPLTSLADVPMLLPQTLTAWDNETEQMGTTAPATARCYLQVALRIKDGDGRYIFGNETTDATVYAPFDCGVDGGWKAGQHYKYVLTFAGGYDAAGHPVIQPIKITAAIQPWTEVSVTGEAQH